MNAVMGNLPLEQANASQKQIRGSGLLSAGRVIALVTNLASQVLVIRYLSTTDYGAWAYALSVVALFQVFSALGLDRATSRFVSIYQEQGELSKLFGTLFLVVGTVALTGLVIIGIFLSFPNRSCS